MNVAPATTLVILFRRHDPDRATIRIHGLRQKCKHIVIFHDHREVLHPHTFLGNGKALALPVCHGDALMIIVREEGEVRASGIVDIKLDRAFDIGISKCTDLLIIKQYDSTVCRGIQKALARHRWQKTEVA